VYLKFVIKKAAFTGTLPDFSVFPSRQSGEIPGEKPMQPFVYLHKEGKKKLRDNFEVIIARVRDRRIGGAGDPDPVVGPRRQRGGDGPAGEHTIVGGAGRDRLTHDASL